MTAWKPPRLSPVMSAARQRLLVGRQSELQVFEAVWAEVEHDRRQAVFIGGEPGIGKSRLLAEVAGALHDDGVSVLLGTAVSDPGVPYLPFVEVLDALFGEIDSSDEAIAGLVSPSAALQLSRLSGTVAGHLAGVVSEGADSGVRRDLFDAVSALFRSVCADRRLAVLLEDLHWAEVPTLALLRHVVTSCADLPLLVVGTFRTSTPDHSDDLAAVITDLHRLDGVRRLDLPGLDTDAIIEYLRLGTGLSTQRARAPAAALRERTGGNAFLLKELWVDLERRGGIAALTHPGPGDVEPVPASIAATLTARIDGLGDRVRPVIEIAAIIGTVFDLGDLLAASDDGADIVLAFVDAATALGLIERVIEPSDSYAFVHALTRQAVLDRLVPSQYMRLHARVAEALEPRSARPALVPRLANHYLVACNLGYQEPAYRYATEAGRLAERGLAFEEAARWFARAAQISEITESERTEAQCASAANWVRAGRFPVARAQYGELARVGDPLVRVEAAIGYEDTNWRPGRPDRHAVSLLESALHDAGLDDTDPLAVRAQGSLGRALTFAGEHQRSCEVGAKAIELARGLDRAALVHALTTSLWHGIGPQMIDRQLERTTELAALATAVGDQEAIGAAANFRGMLAYLRGDAAEVDLAQADIAQAAHATGQPYFEYIHGCVAQAKAFLCGDFELAGEWADRALERNDTFGDDLADGPHGVQRYLIARETGGLDHFAAYLTGEESFEGRWRPGLLALFTELGVDRGIDRVLDNLTSGGIVPRSDQALWPIEMVFLTEAVLATGRGELAEELRPLVAVYDGCNLMSGAMVAVFGSANRYLARLDALLGHEADAAANFTRALQMDTAMGSVVHQAETLARHAAFAQRNGSLHQAAELATRARELAGPIGQVRVLRVLDALDASHPSPNSRLPDALTGRELDVLRLLADGLSNREIGEQLFISGNTAANHVRNILAKTGSANRTQAAIFAARHGII